MKKKHQLFAFFIIKILFYIPYVFADSENLPWMTGPLFASGGTVVSRHHNDIQPYFYYTDTKSDPEKKSEKIDLVLENGCYQNLQCNLILAGIINAKEKQTNARGSGFGDMSLGLKYQILTQNKNTIRPNIAIAFKQIFPTGSYKNLKNQTQATGEGAYKTNLSIDMSRLWHINGVHFFNARFDFSYVFPSHANLSGISVYSSDPKDVRLKIGQSFTVNAGFEYSLTKNWVPALDILYTTNAKDFTPLHNPKLNIVSNSTLSIAPELEYNFNQHLGLIGGIWFGLTERNTSNFLSVILSLNYYS